VTVWMEAVFLGLVVFAGIGWALAWCKQQDYRMAMDRWAEASFDACSARATAQDATRTIAERDAELARLRMFRDLIVRAVDEQWREMGGTDDIAEARP
jgi:hypothetical protein